VIFSVDRIRTEQDRAGAPSGATDWLLSTDVFAYRADHDATFLLDWPGFG
jgi:hypothetical protein